MQTNLNGDGDPEGRFVQVNAKEKFFVMGYLNEEGEQQGYGVKIIGDGDIYFG